MESMPERCGSAGRRAKGSGSSPPRTSPPFRHGSSGRAPLRVACPWMTKREVGRGIKPTPSRPPAQKFPRRINRQSFVPRQFHPPPQKPAVGFPQVIAEARHGRWIAKRADAAAHRGPARFAFAACRARRRPLLPRPLPRPCYPRPGRGRGAGLRRRGDADGMAVPRGSPGIPWPSDRCRVARAAPAHAGHDPRRFPRRGLPFRRPRSSRRRRAAPPGALPHPASGLPRLPAAPSPATVS